MKIQITLLVALFISSGLVSQISEVDYTISLGKQNAFRIEHQGADGKIVSKIWENALGKYGKIKKNRKASEWVCLDCQVGALSSSPTSIYFKIEDGKGMATSYTFFDDGEKFVSNENDKKAASAIEDILMEMYYDVKRRVILNELESEEKNLKGFEKEFSKLGKKNEDLHNDIEDYEAKILKAQNDIEQNIMDQADKRLEIEKQTSKIQETTERLNNVGKG